MKRRLSALQTHEETWVGLSRSSSRHYVQSSHPGTFFFILECQDEQVSRQSYMEVRKNFQIFKIEDGKGKLIYGSQTERYLTIIRADENLEGAKKISNGVRENPELKRRDDVFKQRHPCYLF